MCINYALDRDVFCEYVLDMLIRYKTICFAFFLTLSLNTTEYYHILLVNPHKPSVLFVGHTGRQTVEIKTRRRRMWRLIRVSSVSLKNVPTKFE